MASVPCRHRFSAPAAAHRACGRAGQLRSAPRRGQRVDCDQADATVRATGRATRARYGGYRCALLAPYEAELPDRADAAHYARGAVDRARAPRRHARTPRRSMPRCAGPGRSIERVHESDRARPVRCRDQASAVARLAILHGSSAICASRRDRHRHSDGAALRPEPSGAGLVAAPLGHWRTTTLHRRPQADRHGRATRAGRAAAWPGFRADVAQCLAPAFQPGDVLVLHNGRSDTVAGSAMHSLRPVSRNNRPPAQSSPAHRMRPLSRPLRLWFHIRDGRNSGLRARLAASQAHLHHPGGAPATAARGVSGAETRWSAAERPRKRCRSGRASKPVRLALATTLPLDTDHRTGI